MLRLTLVVCALAFAVALPAHLDESYSFDQYLAEFGKSNLSTHAYAMRKAIFEENLDKILTHNRANKGWKLSVNKFTDRTADEVRRMLGYNKHIGFSAALSNTAIVAQKKVNVSDLPASVDWREKGALTPVKDQGGCGSCWTFAAAETLEAHYFLKTGKLVELSEQQIASCTSNPKHCGGTGGCAGGTAQVAYDSIKAMGGIQTEWTYPYTSYQGENFKCSFVQSEAAVQISGYTQLPHNDHDSLLEAIATVGPIAISVDASSWSMYGSGVFDGCNQKTPDVNHAVVLVGYGTENGNDYWLVRNSWGPDWGENGYIRVRRYAKPECGTDVTPEHGSGCDGGPKTVEACGTCAILFDSCYPNVA